MKKILNYVLITVFAVFTASCEDDVTEGTVNYVTFERGPISADLAKDASSTFDVNVYTGNKRGSDRTYSIMVSDASTLNASNYSVPGTVTIPGNSNQGTFSISFTDNDDLGFESKELIVEFIDEAGISQSDALTINVVEECLDTIVTFNITTDTWPNETTWSLFDLSGPMPTVIASGGPYDNTDDVDDNTLFSFDFCLTSGDYGIAVFDSFGDGGPVYSVTSGGVNLVPDTNVSGNQSTATFTVN